ncbi:MAG: response regulator [Pseudomonadota bacterium]
MKGKYVISCLMIMPRVLVIDDENHIRYLYKEELTDEGYEVSLAGSAKEALDILKDDKFDVAVLDIKLGDTGGLDLLQHLHELYPSLPVIICTAYDSFQDHPMTQYARNYIVKSFNLTNLKHSLADILSSKNRADG